MLQILNTTVYLGKAAPGIGASSGSGGGGTIPTVEWYPGVDGSTLSFNKDLSGAKLLKVYKDGVLLQEGVDYAVSGNELTFTTALTTSNKVTLEIYGKLLQQITITSDIDSNLVIESVGVSVISDTDEAVVLDGLDVYSDKKGNIVL